MSPSNPPPALIRRTLSTLLLVLPLLACGGDGGGSEPQGTPDGKGPLVPLFLPTDTPENTTAPTVEVDAKGGVHAVYPVRSRGDAFYAYCASDCGAPSRFKVVRFDTDGSVANVTLQLDDAGKPHVLMATSLRLYYAVCTGDCTQAAGWVTRVILEQGADLDVSGESFALDRLGRPRFLMHSYPQLLASTQRSFETYYVTCDADCLSPSSWKANLLSTDEAWRGSQLRFDAQNRPRVATLARIRTAGGRATDIIGYAECNERCDEGASWSAVGLDAVYDVIRDEVDPAVSMALTRAGSPRIALLHKDESDAGALRYFACDTDCLGENWSVLELASSASLDSGLDLALDGSDRPRLVYTLNDDIVLASCQADCGTAAAQWKRAAVEHSGDMEADKVIPYPNCTISAWFLQQPSLALGPDGQAHVAYQALDYSGGTSNPDPNAPPCTAGMDMTFSRIHRLAVP
jgi:hypothetical protein